MNSYKTVFVVAILGAVAYGAYVTITRKQKLAEPQTEAPPFVSTGVSEAPVAALTAPEFSSSMSPGASAAGSASTQIPQSRVNLAPPPVTSANNAPVSMDSGVVPFGEADTTMGMVNGAGKAPPVDSLAPPAEGAAASMESIQRQLDEGQLKEAHLALTNVYNQPDLPPAQRSQITEVLDQLAGGVIYSREHRLEAPYVVQMDDTLESIARSYNVPWRLLANINGIAEPYQLQEAQELKVVRGPFDAVVSLRDYELTLMVGGRYAGRFAIGVGEDCAELDQMGTFLVSGKTENPVYYGPGNEQVAAGDPNNPLGRYCLSLSDSNGKPIRVTIHGASSAANLHQTGGRGSICLDPKDVEDIFGILSAGLVPPSPGSPLASRVTIIR